MGHRITTLESRLEWEQDNLVLILKNKWKDEEMDIVKLYQDGKMYGKNISCSAIAGWVYWSPKDKYYSEPYGVDDWWEIKTNTCSLLYYGELTTTYKEQEKLFENSEFKYTFKALTTLYTPSDYITMLVYQKWLEHGNLVELLLKAKQLDLALSKAIYSKPKKYLAFLRKATKSYRSISDLEADMKGVDAYTYRACKRNLELTKYLTRQRQFYHLYADYIEMCKKLNKNLKDDYWKYPSNLRERHDIVLEQYNRVLEAEQEVQRQRWLEQEQRRLEQERQEMERKKEKDLSIQNKMSSLIMNQMMKTINGYQIYISNSVQDMIEQAKELNQCIIACGYYERVANGNELLLFVKKDGVRLATCEMFYDKRIGQFYGDERDRNNCLPSDDIKQAMNEYIALLPNNLKKAIATI